MKKIITNLVQFISKVGKNRKILLIIGGFFIFVTVGYVAYISNEVTKSNKNIGNIESMTQTTKQKFNECKLSSQVGCEKEYATINAEIQKSIDELKQKKANGIGACDTALVKNKKSIAYQEGASFDVCGLVPGDTFGNYKVLTVSKSDNTKSLSESNYKVTFEGSSEVTGEYPGTYGMGGPPSYEYGLLLNTDSGKLPGAMYVRYLGARNNYKFDIKEGENCIVKALVKEVIIENGEASANFENGEVVNCY